MNHSYGISGRATIPMTSDTQTSLRSTRGHPRQRTQTHLILEEVIKTQELLDAMDEITRISKLRLSTLYAGRTFNERIRFAATVQTDTEIIQFLVERVHGLTIRHATILVQEALATAK